MARPLPATECTDCERMASSAATRSAAVSGCGRCTIHHSMRSRAMARPAARPALTIAGMRGQALEPSARGWKSTRRVRPASPSATIARARWPAGKVALQITGDECRSATGARGRALQRELGVEGADQVAEEGTADSHVAQPSDPEGGSDEAGQDETGEGPPGPQPAGGLEVPRHHGTVGVGQVEDVGSGPSVDGLVVDRLIGCCGRAPTVSC
ncbi:MAG: hypothetical protein ACT4OM_01500 [Actinomycetota bacterium]